MPYSHKNIQKILRGSIDSSPEVVSAFFKTAPGQYAEFDKFLGIKIPTLRKIAQQFFNLPLEITEEFLHSTFNEERAFALIIFVLQYQKADPIKKESIYQLYNKNMPYINNWNLVDISAHHIVGAHLWDKRDRNVLLKMARASNFWQRRISIVATWYFIKRQELTYTTEIAKILLSDQQDLIHKACGWMLREVGKQNTGVLLDFLQCHCTHMPRTMLRYAIEKLPQNTRKLYLNKKCHKIP